MENKKNDYGMPPAEEVLRDIEKIKKRARNLIDWGDSEFMDEIRKAKSK